MGRCARRGDGVEASGGASRKPLNTAQKPSLDHAGLSIPPGSGVPRDRDPLPRLYRRRAPQRALRGRLVYRTDRTRAGRSGCPLPRHRRPEGPRPPLFDSDFYAAGLASTPEARVNPLAHYQSAGDAGGRDPSLWVDAAWYRTAHGVGTARGRDRRSANTGRRDRSRAGRRTRSSISTGIARATRERCPTRTRWSTSSTSGLLRGGCRTAPSTARAPSQGPPRRSGPSSPMPPGRRTAGAARQLQELRRGGRGGIPRRA